MATSGYVLTSATPKRQYCILEELLPTPVYNQVTGVFLCYVCFVGLNERSPINRGTFSQYSSYAFPYCCLSHVSSLKGSITNRRITNVPVTKAMDEYAARIIPAYTRMKPTYCGFREYRYGPFVTSFPFKPRLWCALNVFVPHIAMPLPIKIAKPPIKKRTQ